MPIITARSQSHIHVSDPCQTRHVHRFRPAHIINVRCRRLVRNNLNRYLVYFTFSKFCERSFTFRTGLNNKYHLFLVTCRVILIHQEVAVILLWEVVTPRIRPWGEGILHTPRQIVKRHSRIFLSRNPALLRHVVWCPVPRAPWVLQV